MAKLKMEMVNGELYDYGFSIKVHSIQMSFNLDDLAPHLLYNPFALFF